MHVKPSAFILVMFLLILGLLPSGCRRIQNPMPTDLGHSHGFLVNYEITNPDFKTALPALKPKRFKDARLRVFVPENYLSPLLLAAYAKKSGVQVEALVYKNSDELLRYAEGPESIDVGFASAYLTQTLVQKDLLGDLDWDNIPNESQVAPEYRSLVFDPKNRHSIMLLWNTCGIAYNASLLNKAPQTWKDLLEPAPAEAAVVGSKIGLMESPQRILGAALIRLGYSQESHDAAEVKAAVDYIERVAAQRHFRLIAEDKMADALAKGEVVLAMANASDAVRAAKLNPHISFVAPQDGNWVSSTNLFIPKKVTGRQKLVAEDFINFMLHPTVAAEVANRAHKSTTEPAALAFLDADVKNGPASLRAPGPINLLLDDTNPVALAWYRSAKSIFPQ